MGVSASLSDKSASSVNSEIRPKEWENDWPTTIDCFIVPIKDLRLILLYGSWPVEWPEYYPKTYAMELRIGRDRDDTAILLYNKNGAGVVHEGNFIETRELYIIKYKNIYHTLRGVKCYTYMEPYISLNMLKLMRYTAHKGPHGEPIIGIHTYESSGSRVYRIGDKLYIFDTHISRLIHGFTLSKPEVFVDLDTLKMVSFKCDYLANCKVDNFTLDDSTCIIDDKKFIFLKGRKLNVEFVKKIGSCSAHKIDDIYVLCVGEWALQLEEVSNN